MCFQQIGCIIKGVELATARSCVAEILGPAAIGRSREDIEHKLKIIMFMNNFWVQFLTLGAEFNHGSRLNAVVSSKTVFLETFEK